MNGTVQDAWQGDPKGVNLLYWLTNPVHALDIAARAV
jgi:hypothetical protein